MKYWSSQERRIVMGTSADKGLRPDRRQKTTALKPRIILPNFRHFTKTHKIGAQSPESPIANGRKWTPSVIQPT